MSAQTSTPTHTSAATTTIQPVGWSAADERFFRIAGDLFAAPFLAGASALLASYDNDD